MKYAHAMTARAPLLALLPPFLLAASGQGLQTAFLDHVSGGPDIWAVEGAPRMVLALGLVKATALLLSVVWGASRLASGFATPLHPAPFRDMLAEFRVGRAEVVAHGGMLLAALAVVPFHIRAVSQVRLAGTSPLWVAVDAALIGTLAVGMGLSLWRGMAVRGRQWSGREVG